MNSYPVLRKMENDIVDNREVNSKGQKKGRKKVPLWVVGVCVGILFLVIGAFQQQFTDIYRKAVMICLECIGIG